MTGSRVSLRSRSRVSGSSAASGLMVSTWPLTMPNLLNCHLVANMEKLSHGSGEPADALRKHLYTLQAPFTSLRRIASEQSTFNRDNWGGEHLRVDLRWEHGAPSHGQVNLVRLSEST